MDNVNMLTGLRGHKLALSAIADMHVDETTDTAQVLALCIAIAQIALGREDRENGQG